MIRKSDKRGADLITVVIWLAIAVVIGVIVILNIGGGQSSVADWWNNLVGKENVNTISQGCQSACIANSKYDFCDKTRVLSYKNPDGKIKKITGSCFDFAIGTQQITGLPTFNIEDCSQLDCGYTHDKTIYTKDKLPAVDAACTTKYILDKEDTGSYNFVACPKA